MNRQKNLGLVKIALLFSISFFLGVGCKPNSPTVARTLALNDKETRVFDFNDANQDHFTLDQATTEIGKMMSKGIMGKNYAELNCRQCDGFGTYHNVVRQQGILAASPVMSAIGIARFRPNAIVNLKAWNLGQCSLQSRPGAMPLLGSSEGNIGVMGLSHNYISCTNAPGAVTIRLSVDNGSRILDTVTIPVAMSDELQQSIQVGPRANAMRNRREHSVDDEWIIGDMSKISLEVILEGGHMGGLVDSITIEAEYVYQ